MGAAHVSACYAQWSHLPDRPFRVLAYMALIAKDSTPEPTFWGGRDALCIALGIEADPAGYRVIRRALAELIDAGALERKYVGHAGKRSEYRVHVTPRKGDTSDPQSPAGTTEKGGHVSPPEGGHLSPQRRTPQSAKEDTSVPPRTTRNTRSEKEEEISSTHSSTDRARETSADEMTAFQAQAILDRAAAEGTDIVALLALAPEGSTRYQRRMWAARQLQAKEAS